MGPVVWARVCQLSAWASVSNTHAHISSSGHSKEEVMWTCRLTEIITVGVFSLTAPSRSDHFYPFSAAALLLEVCFTVDSLYKSCMRTCCLLLVQVSIFALKGNKLIMYFILVSSTNAFIIALMLMSCGGKGAHWMKKCFKIYI